MKPALTWTIAASGLLLLSGAMAWATWSLVGMERTRHRLEAGAVVQERARLALWRMESVAAALVLEESARPPAQYDPPAGEEGAVSSPPDPAGRVWLHFEMTPDGRVHSPQVREDASAPAASGSSPGSAPGEPARRLEELRLRLAEKAGPGQWAGLGVELRRRERSASSNSAWLAFANTNPSSSPPPVPSDFGEDAGTGVSPAADEAVASAESGSVHGERKAGAPSPDGVAAGVSGAGGQNRAARQDYTPAQLPSASRPVELERNQELYNRIEAATRRRVFSDVGKNLTWNQSPPPEMAQEKKEPAQSGKPGIPHEVPDKDAGPRTAAAGPRPKAAVKKQTPSSAQDAGNPMAAATITAVPEKAESMETAAPAAPAAPASPPALAAAAARRAGTPAPAGNPDPTDPTDPSDPSDKSDKKHPPAPHPPPASGSRAESSPAVTVSGFRALWIRDALFLTRKISRNGAVSIQGAWIDWPGLRENLLATVADLFPAAELRPAPPGPGGGPDLLASLPLRFVPGPLELPAPRFWSPLKLSLATAWTCVLLATAAVCLVLRGMMLLSARRASFVSAVTHELRTPLATFKLYSEMLADGMVRDETKRQRYLETLTTEADRLGHLVENVLSYSRLENGKVPAGRAPVAVHDLLQRLGPRLSQRCGQAGAEWGISAATLPGGLSLTTDPAAVDQILFNLVDNACKYARQGPAAAHVELDVRLEKGRVLFAVRDHGPGISRAESGKLFRPFHKSARDAAHTAPGVGLGLALCRRLARDLGGTLKPDHTWPHGACFVLSLPA